MLLGVPDKAEREPFEARFDSHSTKKGREMDYLVKIYKSTQDVLKTQEEHENAIAKCRKRVNLMTEELETLQSKTDKKRNLEEVR